MPEFSIQILLVALCLVLPVLFFLLSKKPGLGNCLIVFLALGLIFIAFFALSILDPIKRYQCLYEIPDQIGIAGHIQDNANPDLNDHLVILFKGDEEIDRFVTRHGSFAIDEKDEARDGYFELAVPNEFQLTRCSMKMNFKQDSFGHDLLWLENETTYLWHNFAGIEAGTYPLNHGEPGEVYTLVVLPGDKDHFPIEMSLYPAYLDRNREVAINAQIQTYRILSSPAASPTGFFIRPNPLSNLARGISFPAAAPEVWDAWAVGGSTGETTGSSHLAPVILDRDNCSGSLPAKAFVPIPLTYIQEVQFEENTNLNFDLGAAAFKADPSLGFSQGQMKTIVAQVPVDVPPGTHKKYKVHWQDLWRTGSMSVDFGQSNVQVHFRARIGMGWDQVEFPVDCP